MIRQVALLVLIAGPAAGAQHLAEVRQGIMACDTPACIGEAATFCMENEDDGQTTVGMMSCLLAERDVWDERLNAAYKDARAFAKAMDAEDMTHFPEYAVRADQVRDAQRAWIVFRDANCAMEYGLWGSGSFRQVMGADCLMQMTAERTLDLIAYTEMMR